MSISSKVGDGGGHYSAASSPRCRRRSTQASTRQRRTTRASIWRHALRESDTSPGWKPFHVRDPIEPLHSGRRGGCKAEMQTLHASRVSQVPHCTAVAVGRTCMCSPNPRYGHAPNWHVLPELALRSRSQLARVARTCTTVTLQTCMCVIWNGREWNKVFL